MHKLAGQTAQAIEAPAMIADVALANEFKPFPKIPRLNRDVLVTEKIDGTNACIRINEDGSILVGKRTSWITPQSDNFGFATWVKANEEEIRQLGPGTHYGEWYGSGIQRRYGLVEKRFALFNVTRWNENAPRPACCGVVPMLGRGEQATTVAAALRRLRTEGSVAVPGFMKPEGIVVYHFASGALFKVTLENDEAPRGQKEAAE